MIIKGRPVKIAPEDLTLVHNARGYVQGRIYKNLYQFYGGIFRILDGIPFQEDEYNILKNHDVKYVELVQHDVVTIHQEWPTIEELGTWIKHPQWGTRFLIKTKDWLPGESKFHKEVHEDGSISGSGR
jgi:hypothetical protein